MIVAICIIAVVAQCLRLWIIFVHLFPDMSVFRRITLTPTPNTGTSPADQMNQPHQTH